MVAQLAIEGLEARALSDPAVAAALTAAGLKTPARPALLIISEDGAVELLTGLAMRRRLAAVMGLRRARAMIGLLAAEWHARRSNAATSHQPARRTVLGGALAALAGLAGWSLMPGTAAASSLPSGKKPTLRLADREDVAAALTTTAVQQAIRTWGPVEPDAYHVLRDGQPSLMLLHSRHNVLTVLDGSPAALRSGNPAAVSLLPLPGTGKVFRFYTVSGTPLGDMSLSRGKIVVSAPGGTPGPGGTREVEPDAPAHYYCFIGCLNSKISMGCFDTCTSCATDIPINPGWKTWFGCLNCAACAGPHAYACIKECWFGT
jgi:hypothetical protein